MRKALLGSVIFLVGVCAGAVGTDFLHRAARGQLASILSSGVQVREEFQASRAAREGRLVESLVHRSNAASAAAGTGLTALEQSVDEVLDVPFSPLVWWSIREKTRRKYPNAYKPEGRRRRAAILVHQAALTLDALGLSAEAAEQRESVAADLPAALAQASFVELLEAESTPLHLTAEELTLRAMQR